MLKFKREFLEFAIRRGAIRFGDFVTKAGRPSPYFFNAGLFNDGESLGQLAQFYVKAIEEARIEFDMLFGSAYKGIPLVAGVAMAHMAAGRNYPFAFNRKEVKDHGEGGAVVGAALTGRVLIVDDVISAGTSVRESVDLIRAHGAAPVGVAIALDRMERGVGELSAVQEVERTYGLRVVSIVTLDDLVEYLESEQRYALDLGRVTQYREVYGVVSR